MSAIWEDIAYIDTLVKNWNTKPREEHLLRFMSTLVRRGTTRKWENVLDVGCGIGRFSRLFSREENYLGVDSSPVMVREALRRGVNVRQESIYKLPFPDNHFDLVICQAVLFHICDVPAAVKELWRVTKERLIFSCYYKKWSMSHRVEVIPSEDKESGQIFLTTRNVIPRWMLKRLVAKHLKVPSAKRSYVWALPYAHGSTPYAYTCLEK